MSVTITEGILVEVQSAFVPERSTPEADEFFFAYTVRISNTGKRTVQLVSRHWVITDSHGRVEEVRGAGVVGKQPVLQPGESFQYTSACPLTTPYGTMHGSYQMVCEDGTQFDAAIAEFELAVPTESRSRLLN